MNRCSLLVTRCSFSYAPTPPIIICGFVQSKTQLFEYRVVDVGPTSIWNTMSEELLQEAREWVKSNVVIDYSKEGAILQVHAATVLAVPASACFGLLAHPYGEEVWRGIKACVKRKVLENDGDGNLLLEVHNESHWSVFGLAGGSVVSQLLVETSLRRNLIHFGLIPGSSQMLSDMYGVWRCYDFASDELREFLELDSVHPALCEEKIRAGSLVTLYQRFEFSIPSILHGTVARAAVGQIRSSLEDLVVAVWRLQRGSLNLPPLMAVIMKEIDREPDGEHHRGHPPSSVDSTSAKSILDEKARAFVKRANSAVNDQVSSMLREELEACYEGRDTAADRQADAEDEPASHPLSRSLDFLSRSMRSLSSLEPGLGATVLEAHPLGSIKSLSSLVEFEATALAVQRSIGEQGQGPETASARRPSRGFFRRMKSMIDMYMGSDIGDGEQAEYDELHEFDDPEWWVVA